ncbi:MAG TPA: right-handed parallel beta-helix repeat-containing protein [Candidatus Udaeobacter sp.]|nr:right-handed parallel beta-helix repeat-containing protein [Candidatus Udaeobacter sp.]
MLKHLVEVRPRPLPVFPALALAWLLLALPARARDLRVPDEHPTIQAALDAAMAGDRVQVGPGLYREIVSLHDSVTVESDPPWEAVVVGEVHMHFLKHATFAGFRVISNYGGIHCFGGVDNRITGNLVSGGDDTVGPGITCFDGSALIDENVVFRRFGIGIYLERSAATIVRNTIVENGSDERPRAGIHCGPGATPLIEGNIIAFGRGPAILCETGANPSVRCNDLFANSGGDAVCGTESGSNLAIDPGFCDRLAGQLSLRTDSPCANAAGCGRMGAQAVGCAASAVEAATWGRIKARPFGE